MLFSSLPFLYYFLPCTLIVYFITPRKLKNAVLLFASLFFYGWGEPRCVIIMLFAIVLGYIFGILIEHFSQTPKLAKLFLAISVFLNLLMLCYFKYADFFIANFNSLTNLSIPLLKVALPVGISFYTFQILSYTVDVYRGDVAAQRNFVDLAAYISFFPQLIAGPIVRYCDIDSQLQSRTHSPEKVSSGIRRFIIGLAKKVLLANLLGELCDVFRTSSDKSVLFFWLYAISYSLHIYFDFSGYSDMAIGLGKIFGFSFLENFNYPYIAGSITDFWHRWHISLGSWFRDYVYIPLGGNRVGIIRHLFNIFLVWMLTGFWHGASWNFILWGLYFALLLIIEKLFLLKYLKKSQILKHIYVVISVVFSFVLFDASSIANALSYTGAMLGVGSYPIVSAEFLYYLRSFGIILVIAVIGATPLPKQIWKRFSATSFGDKLSVILEPVLLSLLLITCTAYLVDGSYNPFLYFRF